MGAAGACACVCGYAWDELSLLAASMACDLGWGPLARCKWPAESPFWLHDAAEMQADVHGPTETLFHYALHAGKAGGWGVVRAHVLAASLGRLIKLSQQGAAAAAVLQSVKALAGARVLRQGGSGIGDVVNAVLFPWKQHASCPPPFLCVVRRDGDTHCTPCCGL